MDKAKVRSEVWRNECDKGIYRYKDISEITKTSQSYVVDYWEKQKNKYQYNEIWAIITPRSFAEMDIVFFLDTGVVMTGIFIPYEDFMFVGTAEYFHGIKTNFVYLICCKNDRIIKTSTKMFVSNFAAMVIDRLICLQNGIKGDENKIKYYMDMLTPDEDLKNYILYKKIIGMSTEPSVVGDIVRKYGYKECVLIRQELFEKLNRETWKTFPKVYIQTLTLRLKKADRTIAESRVKMHKKIMDKMRDDLQLLIKCNEIRGYELYVSEFYSMMYNACIAKKQLEESYVHEFNLMTNELREKIETESICLVTDNPFEVLWIFYLLGELYSGIVRDDNGKEYKCNYIKNSDRALFWLELFEKEECADSSLEYEHAMFMLSSLYKYGTKSTEASEEKMIRCLKNAAYHGNVKASKYLAEYYIKQGDETEKEKWIQLAKECGQKVKDKRSLNEKMKESVGIDIQEATETVEAAMNIGRNISGFISSIRDAADSIQGIASAYQEAKADKKETDNRIAEAERVSEIRELQHIQEKEGQEAANLKAKEKNMRTKRKAEKGIAKETKKSN